MSGNLNLDSLCKEIAISFEHHLKLNLESITDFMSSLDIPKPSKGTLNSSFTEIYDLTFTTVLSNLNSLATTFQDDFSLTSEPELPQTQTSDQELLILSQKISEQKHLQSQLEYELALGLKRLDETNSYLTLLQSCKTQSEENLLSKLKDL